MYAFMYAWMHKCIYIQGFFVTVRAGTAYRHLFWREEKKIVKP